MPATVRPPAIDPARLLRELTTAHVLSEDQAPRILAEFRDAGAGDGGQKLVEFLLTAGLVTSFQADRILSGEAVKLAVGPYLLQEPVGVGSLGTVYRAIRRDDRKRYAIKVLPLRSLWNVLQARRQVEVFSELPAHTAIVPFVDIGTANGSHYLAWPFIEGETIDALVRRTGPLEAAKAASLMAEVAEALALCHRHQIIHGLLKPSNLMMGPDRKPRILDFGVGAILAENLSDRESLLDTISTANTTRGSLECSAPETLSNPNLLTPAADSYSFGCVLYFILTGVYPFPDVSAVDQIIAHQTQDPVPVQSRNSTVPDPLARLVEQLMKKAPGERPANLELVQSQLRANAVIATPPVSVSVSTPSSPVRRDASPDSISFNLPDIDPHGEAPAASFILLDRAGPDRVSQDIPLLQTVRTPKPAPKQVILKSRLDSDVGTKPGKPSRQKSKIDFVLPPTPISWLRPADSTGPVSVDLPPPPNPVALRFWRAVRFVFGWVAARDIVQLSVFGPARFAPGQTARLLVYTHPPTAFNSVRTLSRAFLPDTELLASGYTTQLIARGEPVALHLAVGNAGVAKPLLSFQWEGQTRPLTFDVYVPWESSAGRAPAVLSAGLGNIEVANVPFEVMILPRSG